MTRRCSHCSNNGHNSRTCPARSSTATSSSSVSVRLFGVSLTKGVSSMKKSASMSCLSHYSSSSSAHQSGGGDEDFCRTADLIAEGDGGGASGYASDDPNHASCSSSGCRGDRKKGTPWTEDEHRRFLVGLQKLGKGDWRGIARNYVLTRTPTQVASHAQKYFVRQTNSSRRKRRSSLFDMIADVPLENIPPAGEEEQFRHIPPTAEPESASNISPSLNPTLEEASLPVEPITTTYEAISEGSETASASNLPQMMQAFYPAYIPVPLAYWPSCSSSMPAEDSEMGESHEILKPTPLLPTDSVHVDEVGISNLSIVEANNSNRIEPSPLSFKLLAASSTRRSAFHVSSASESSDLNQGSINPIHAV